MQYRRTRLEGGTYFFTVNLADRRRRLLVEHVDVLREVVNTVMHRHPFEIDAFVVMPDHLHAIWTLPSGDADYASRWMLIKAAFSKNVPKGETISASRSAKGERGIWQRRYWEHAIRDDDDFARHVDYIHYNPVKHGYVDLPAAWPYSSIHRYISAGVVPRGWGGGEGIEGVFGER